MSIHEPTDDNGTEQKSIPRRVKITEVRVGNSSYLDMQEKGNPEAFLRFIPGDSDLPLEAER